MFKRGLTQADLGVTGLWRPQQPDSVRHNVAAAPDSQWSCKSPDN